MVIGESLSPEDTRLGTFDATESQARRGNSYCAEGTELNPTRVSRLLSWTPRSDPNRQGGYLLLICDPSSEDAVKRVKHPPTQLRRVKGCCDGHPIWCDDGYV